MVTALYVSPAVSMLQFDLDTDGEFTFNDQIPKQALTNRLSGGLLRVLVFGLDQSVFSGYVGTVSDTIRNISEIVGSNPDASDAHAIMGKLSQIPVANISLRVVG
jgi:hypothetical protein